MSDSPSRRYQDYVIRDGRLIGEFDAMYRCSAEVPWHQDETCDAVFSDLTVAILRRRTIASLLDVGCGLGFMTARLQRELPGLQRVAGLDVSAAAIEAARARFPGIDFRSGTLADYPVDPRFDLVMSKDVLWYVLDNLREYLGELARRSLRYVYIGQSFPERRPFLGDDILPDAQHLVDFVERCGLGVVYSVVERDADYDGREYAHVLSEVSR